MESIATATAMSGGPMAHAEAGELHGEGDVNDSAAQFITFKIGDEEYGVSIMGVREIKGWSATTQLPNSPPYMRGVLNLRGTIVPIYDLRARFGLGETPATTVHVIVIVAVRDRLVGILVDAVSDILTISTAEIRPVPDSQSTDQRFLSGLVSVDDRMVALLELERLFDVRGLPDPERDAATEAAMP